MKIEDIAVFYFSQMDVNRLIQDSIIPFDLYINLKGKMTLYKKREDNLKIKDITRLKDNSYTHVLVHNRDLQKKRDFTEKNLEYYLSLKGVNTHFKVDSIYEALTNVSSRVFESPEAPGMPDRIHSLMTPTTRFMMETPDAFQSLLSITRHESYDTTHPVNVSLSLIALAAKDGIDDFQTLMEAGTGGLLHDIGKINIPDSIINKRETLTEAEWDMIREHPADGVEIARKYKLTGETGVSIISNHHEKRNGTGYPSGLVGKDKGDLAEMTSIVDVFDAITSDKPYSMAKPPKDGANYLLSHMGEYDKRLVLLFIKLLSE